MSSLDLIILGALKERPQYAGEIQSNLKRRKIHKMIHFNLGAIYKKATELEKEGYIKGKNVQREKGSDIRVYSITEEGKNYFDELVQLRSKLPTLNIYVDINDLILTFEFVEEKNRILYFRKIREEIEKEKNKLYLNKDFKSYIDELLYKQQEKLLSALEEWLKEAEEELILGRNKIY